MSGFQSHLPRRHLHSRKRQPRRLPQLPQVLSLPLLSDCTQKLKERPVASVYVSNYDLIKLRLKCHNLYQVPLPKECKKHVCRLPKCKMCGETLPLDTDILRGYHLCYIQPCPLVTEHNEKLIIYDF